MLLRGRVNKGGDLEGDEWGVEREMENEGVLRLKQIFLIPLLGNLADQETETSKYVFEVRKVVFVSREKKWEFLFLCE